MQWTALISSDLKIGMMGGPFIEMPVIRAATVMFPLKRDIVVT
jgi:hypothetical protein